eukprot:5653725-Prymnesium_polylepis.1
MSPIVTDVIANWAEPRRKASRPTDLSRSSCGRSGVGEWVQASREWGGHARWWVGVAWGCWWRTLCFLLCGGPSFPSVGRALSPF